MSQDGDSSTNILEDSRVHTLIGLASGLTIAVVAVLFLDGIAFWVALGIAVLEVLVTPYLLKMTFGGAGDHPDVGDSGG